jgi:hypothetical protein
LIKKILNRVRDELIFFQSGHGLAVYPISIWNFITIQYTLWLSQLSFALAFMPSIFHFAIVFLLSYVPLMLILGRLEWRFGGPKRTPQINPYIQDSIRSDILLREGIIALLQGDTILSEKKMQESLRIKSKWLRVNK